MIIDKKITINRYPYTNTQTNQVVYPDPIELDNLDISFVDLPKQKMIQAKIENFPSPIVLFGPQLYDKMKDYTKSDLEKRTLEILGDNPQEILQKLIPRTLEADPNGPGTILSGMLSSLGIKSSSTCSCKRRAVAMNMQGPEWCEQNTETILSWLEEEAKKRKLPFVKMIASAMVNRAIKKSKRLLAKNNNG